MSEWIDVRDRLPEVPVIGQKKPYLVTDGRSVVIQDYYLAHSVFGKPDYDEFWFGNEETNKAVTHWQPIPEPPK